MFWIRVSEVERHAVEELRKANILKVLTCIKKTSLIEHFVYINAQALEAKQNRLKSVYYWCCDSNTNFIDKLSQDDLTHLKTCLPLLLGRQGRIALTKEGHTILDTKNLV